MDAVAEAQDSDLAKTLLRVAWVAIVFGLLLEALVVFIAAEFGTLKSLKPFLADLGYKVSWAVIVCVGLAMGTVAAQKRELMMGLLGLLAAPIAFYVARAVHKGTLQAFDLAVDNPGFNPMMMAAVKGLEYGVLGAALGMIQQREWGGAMAHTVVGAAVGITFGSLIVAIIMHSAPNPIPHPALVGRAVNELLFPVGCSLVLYAAEVLGRKLQR
jgi:hypothetical protein